MAKPICYIRQHGNMAGAHREHRFDRGRVVKLRQWCAVPPCGLLIPILTIACITV